MQRSNCLGPLYSNLATLLLQSHKRNENSKIGVTQCRSGIGSLAPNCHVLVDCRRLCSEPPECFHLVRTSLQNLLHHFKRPHRFGHTLR